LNFRVESFPFNALHLEFLLIFAFLDVKQTAEAEHCASFFQSELDVFIEQHLFIDFPKGFDTEKEAKEEVSCFSCCTFY